MSGLIVNILRRRAFYAINNKVSEVSIPALILNRDFSSTLRFQQKQNVDSKNSSDDDKKKKKDSVKITLLGKNNNVTVTSLEEAQKLSHRRNMTLVKVQDFDVKTQRPVYQMLTTSELLTEEGSDKKSAGSSKKNEKLLNIGSRIADHDLASRLKNISKWLQKGIEVRVLIHGTDASDPGVEKVFNAVENASKEAGARIVQKVNKGGNMKFNIIPPSAGSSEGKGS